MLNNRQAGRRRGRGGQRQQTGNGRDNGNRIDNRARGNAPQLLEKYKSLARDAQMQGDRVLTEYYLQFADHYFRVVSETRTRSEETRRPRDDWQGDDGYDGDGDDGQGEMNDGGDDEIAPRPERYERNDRPERNERPERSERAERNDRPERAERAPRPERSDRGDAPRRRDARGPESSAPRSNGHAEGVGDIDTATIDFDRLPPAISIASEPVHDEDRGDDLHVEREEAPAPRRRGRPRRPTVAEEGSEG